MPPRVFRVRTWSLTPMRGPLAGSRMRWGGGGAAETVAQVAACVTDALDLGVLAEEIGDLEVAGFDLTSDGQGIEQRLMGEAVHLGDEFVQGVCEDEVFAVAFEGFHGSRCAPAREAGSEEGDQVLFCHVGVLFGAGEGELLLDDLLGEDEPGVAVVGDVLGGGHVSQRTEGVVPGEAGVRQASAEGVKP